MEAAQRAAIDEMKREIHQWFDQLEKQDAADTVKRTKLQVGVFDYALIDCTAEPIQIVDHDLGFGWPDEKDEQPDSHALFTIEQIQTLIKPQLAEVIGERLDLLASSPVTDYRFTFCGKFRAVESVIELALVQYVNEAKKQELLGHIQTYVAQKLDAGNFPTKPLDTFFLVRHLLSGQLFPQLDGDWIIAKFEKILELNKSRKEALQEHRSYIIMMLKAWVENQLLPMYFAIEEGEDGRKQYILKSEAAADPVQPGQITLLLYAAVAILRFEPSYSKSRGLSFIDCARQLGSGKATQLLEEGSGAYPKEDSDYSDAFVHCKANDVFSTITIVIKQEEEQSYGRAVSFIIRLLQQGFPKSYKIKLKSSEKHYLPLKGLAKSDTHRFFANALAFEELHPQLEQYAREAMEEFEWYGDAEDEKSCMPGSYAAFGLGLADPRYFSLVEQYMKLVDVEHQSVQNKFAAEFAARYGVNADSIATLVVCMLHSTEELKLKIKPAFEEEANLELLLERVAGLHNYEVEHLIYLIWGGTDKLKAAARKTKDTRQPLMEQLLQASY
ncbi:hypothetical protein BBD42_22720 [Paenibacillus sp. BIHB 4019]|uniref:Uncharacterized protein n=1 Tax=Paenibacillus sp. BIHB 4019 TaxID=1870819 RepID=A0A1B2DMP8_9BACL|nr:DUF6138 family protein [Paenibacillus sp. BIHB 4019]ANY68985.1 hypothetical protein BBD42_22720 [Paenibacillus sp. BIHB 4019]